MNVKISRIILVVCATIILVFQIYQNVFYYKRIIQPSEKQKVDKKINQTKYILYWTTFFRSIDFNLGTGREPFAHCPVSDCFATAQRDLMPIENYDALMFHGMEYGILEYNNIPKFGVPQKRSAHQVYIYVMYESPVYASITEKIVPKYFYNWTMTYRRDSDIWKPYGIIKRKPTNDKVPTINTILEKNKTIAWFVSNCEALSLRQELYRQMKKFVDIDVYGKCGMYECKRSKENECYKMLEKQYKFYLSFENSLCEDYVTEKLFNILKLDVIPIVYGGANYEKIAPPKSVINVNDFKSVEQLVDYIKFLDNNPKEYLKYFDWKKEHIVDTSNNDSLCDLCSKLHGNIKPKSYKDINLWWQLSDATKSICNSVPKIFNFLRLK